MSRISQFTLAGALVVGLAACATAPSTEEGQEPPLTVEEVLASTMAESAYGGTKRCLPAHAYEKADVLDTQHLLFWGRRNTAWINTLPIKCPGLRRQHALQFERHGGQLCKQDTVASIDRSLVGFHQMSAKCSLGEFREMTHEQAKVLLSELDG